MNVEFTRWTHHGESAIHVNVEFIEQAHPHEYDGIWESHRYDGIHVSEEPNDDNQEIPDLEMLSKLYAAVEEDGQLPNFTRVLKDLKWTLCPGSSHSRFSFLVRLLHNKSRY